MTNDAKFEQALGRYNRSCLQFIDNLHQHFEVNTPRGTIDKAVVGGKIEFTDIEIKETVEGFLKESNGNIAILNEYISRALSNGGVEAGAFAYDKAIELFNGASDLLEKSLEHMRKNNTEDFNGNPPKKDSPAKDYMKKNIFRCAGCVFRCTKARKSVRKRFYSGHRSKNMVE